MSAVLWMFALDLCDFLDELLSCSLTNLAKTTTVKVHYCSSAVYKGKRI